MLDLDLLPRDAAVARMNGAVFLAVYQRDLRLAWRRRTEALLPVAFFLVAASLFPLGVGPDPQVLKLIAPGVVWVCALLAAMLSMPPLYAADHADGSLEQLLLAPGRRPGRGRREGRRRTGRSAARRWSSARRCSDCCWACRPRNFRCCSCLCCWGRRS